MRIAQNGRINSSWQHFCAISGKCQIMSNPQFWSRFAVPCRQKAPKHRRLSVDIQQTYCGELFHVTS